MKKGRSWPSLIAVLVCLALCNMSFSLLAPIFPGKAEALGFSEAAVGLVFASHSFGTVVFSPVFARLLQRDVLPRRGLMVGGQVAIGAVAILYGVYTLVWRAEAHPTVFLLASAALRLSQGIGCGATDTAAVATVSEMFAGSPRAASAMGWMQAAACAGWMLGPSLGALASRAWGYSVPFLVLGAACSALAPGLLLSISSSPSPRGPAPPPSAQRSRSASASESPWAALLKLRVLALFAAGTLGSAAFTWHYPSLGARLESLGAGPSAAGWALTAMCVSYCFGGLLCGWFAECIPRAVLVGAGTVGCALAFTPGPVAAARALGTPPQWGLVLGVIATGAFGAAMIVPLVPLLLSAARARSGQERPCDGALGKRAARQGSHGGMRRVQSVLYDPVDASHVASSDGSEGQSVREYKERGLGQEWELYNAAQCCCDAGASAHSKTPPCLQWAASDSESVVATAGKAGTPRPIGIAEQTDPNQANLDVLNAGDVVWPHEGGALLQVANVSHHEHFTHNSASVCNGGGVPHWSKDSAAPDVEYGVQEPTQVETQGHNGVHDVVSGVFNAAYYLGGGVGPIIGGITVDKLGYVAASWLFAGLVGSAGMAVLGGWAAGWYPQVCEGNAKETATEKIITDVSQSGPREPLLAGNHDAD